MGRVHPSGINIVKCVISQTIKYIEVTLSPFVAFDIPFIPGGPGSPTPDSPCNVFMEVLQEW